MGWRQFRIEALEGELKPALDTITAKDARG
jgi:hypothetical protein